MVVEKGREEGGDRDDGQSRGEGVEVSGLRVYGLCLEFSGLRV